MTTQTTTDPAVAESSEFRKLLDDNSFTKIPKVGDIVTGRVISATSTEVRVDVDSYGTGVVRGKEFFDESAEHAELKVGDAVEATVIELENERGELELSFRYAGHQKAWSQLAELQRSGAVVPVEILDANKGGLMVRVGSIVGFLPVSQLSPEHYPRVPGGDKIKIFERLRTYVGAPFSVKVLDVNEREGKLIVSEKAAWEDAQRGVIAQYSLGQVIEGRVTAITDFGVFVEFGEHLEGLVHISELAWQRIENPGDRVAVGDPIKAAIIGIQGSKIFLSAKKLVRDPWQDIASRYAVGATVPGKVLKVNPFGLFVELDAEIHGLAHVSELEEKPATPYAPGTTLDFVIVSIEPLQHRLGLSRKRLGQPAEQIAAEAKGDAQASEQVSASTAVNGETKGEHSDSGK